MRNPESSNNEVFKGFQEQEKGGFTRWVGDRRKEVAALIGGMVLLSGGLAEAGKNKPVDTKEKPTVTSVDKKDTTKNEVVKNILAERSNIDLKQQVEAFSISIDSAALDALKKEGAVISGNKIISKGGNITAFDGEVNGVKTLKIEIKKLPDGTVEVVCYNSDKTRDVAHFVNGEVKAMTNIAPAK